MIALPSLSLSTWAAIALGVLLGIQTMRLSDAKTDLAEETAGRQQDRATWSAASAAESEKQRDIESQRRRARDQEITHAHAENASLDRDAAALRAVVADRLRSAAAEDRTGSEASGDRPAAGRVEAVAAADVVRRELFPDLGEALELVDAYEAARARGLRCERLYDALTASP